MKVVIKARERMTLEEFADTHGLTLEVNERSHRHMPDDVRWYAKFAGAEIGHGRMLRGAFGDGRTPEEAIAAYAVEISEEMLVIDAMSPNRREIAVPIIIPKAES